MSYTEDVYLMNMDIADGNAEHDREFETPHLNWFQRKVWWGQGTPFVASAVLAAGGSFGSFTVLDALGGILGVLGCLVGIAASLCGAYLFLSWRWRAAFLRNRVQASASGAKVLEYALEQRERLLCSIDREDVAELNVHVTNIFDLAREEHRLSTELNGMLGLDNERSTSLSKLKNPVSAEGRVKRSRTIVTGGGSYDAATQPLEGGKLELFDKLEAARRQVLKEMLVSSSDLQVLAEQKEAVEGTLRRLMENPRTVEILQKAEEVVARASDRSSIRRQIEESTYQARAYQDLLKEN